MWTDVIKAIESSPRIMIFPHQQADGDALGSTFGLKALLVHRYPDKVIKVLGKHTKDNGKLFPLFDEADEDEIKVSLAIILDTANHERIDDQRYQLCPMKIKIDHHPGDDFYGDINVVKPEVSSTAELVTGLAKEIYGSEPLPTDAATYLYAGVFSDTMSFSTSSTNVSALETAAYLAKFGVKLDEVAYYFRAKSVNVYKFITELRSRLIIEDDKFAYVIADKDLYRKYGLSFEDAKGNVSEFSRIEGLLVWCVFLEQENTGFQYQGSLRSRYVGINDIASQFHGGGHKFAAGVKLQDHDEVLRCIDALRQRVKEATSDGTGLSI